MSHVGIKKVYIATTTPPRPNMHRYRAASTLLPVYLADAKPVVIVTPAVTTAARTHALLGIMSYQVPELQ